MAWPTYKLELMPKVEARCRNMFSLITLWIDPQNRDECAAEDSSRASGDYRSGQVYVNRVNRQSCPTTPSS